MKKILLMTLLLIIIPFLTIIILKPKEIKTYKYAIEQNVQVRVKRNKLNKIETIPLEKYLIGVLAGEMPISYDIEALKAQAVAARTYAIRKIEMNKNKEYDVIDTTNDQVYKDEQQLKEAWGKNYNTNIKKIKEAINSTRGEYLTYEGETIQAFFFSTSSGTTENCKDVFGENIPYLVSVSSSWDQNSPSYLSTKTFTKEELYNQLNIPYSEKLEIIINRNETNSINEILINNISVKGTDFRYKLGLKSTNLEITQKENEIIITTKGYGHGVGMSQYGAFELAKQGYTYDEILKYYYQGIELEKIKNNV